MPEYLHPGVYIEETSYRGKPIQGVSTSTAGFVGKTRKGPEGKPTLVTSFNDYTRKFGAQISPPELLGDYMGHAVKAFFDNGGSRAFIVSVLAADALAASQTANQGTVLRLPIGTTVRGGATTFTLNSLRNVAVGSVLRVYTRPDTLSPFSESLLLNVQSYDALRNQVTVGANEIPNGTTLTAANTYILVSGVSPHGVAPNTGGPEITAKNRGEDGNNITVNFIPTDRTPVALTSGSALREQPVLETVAGPIADGALTLELTSASLRRLRVGDQIAVGTVEPVTVSAIAAATLDFTINGGGPGADFSAGGANVTLISRGGVNLPTPFELGTVEAGSFDLTGSPVTEANVQHGVAAALVAGDVIRLDDGGNQDDLTITAVQLAQDVAPGAHVTLANPVSPQQTDADIRLLATLDDNTLPTARILVADASSFTSPFRTSSAEPVSITNGSVYSAAQILLVDSASNTLYVTYSNVAGNFGETVTTDNWTTLSSTEVAAHGDTIVSVASTNSFYSGAKVFLDNGTRQFEAVVASVDPAARRIQFSQPLDLGGAGQFIELAANPSDRRAFVRTAEITLEVYENGVLSEVFDGLSWNTDTSTDAYRRYFVERINDDEAGSNLIEITQPGNPGFAQVNQPVTPNGLVMSLLNGSNGSNLTAVDLIGADNGPGNRTGIEALNERDDISIVAVPGVTDESVQSALLTHCELNKYRIAVLDGEKGSNSVSDIQAHRNNYDSKYGAYYAPWLKSLDLTTGRTVLVPPSGHVMGIYARSDANVGVHKAPANEVVRNISDLEFSFTAGEQDILNPAGVNLIRELTPRGIRVWGARTMTSDQEWKYVNVRRLFIFLEHSIDKGTQWVVFEPNNESLWARVVETITSFLTGVWKTGALMGTTADQAFFVRCDRSTMTQDDIDNGRLVVEIGIAPTYPAEFVIFRIGQFTASSN